MESVDQSLLAKASDASVIIRWTTLVHCALESPFAIQGVMV
jgi:hypothetical protein